jgi:tRNA nucleotidyltransferase (CCA-adding enzyme)
MTTAGCRTSVGHDQPRIPRGAPASTGGRYTHARHTEAVTTLEPARGREVIHPFPGLIDLTPATGRVLAAITAAGGHPYLVGGCVRDAIMEPGRVPKDVDVEVFGLDIDSLAGALGTVGCVDQVGREFSVLKIRVAGEDFDVSLPRRDSKVGTGHRGFEVVADLGCTLVEASGRRDFTLNALMFDPAAQEVVDCWGGLGDLRAGVLRHTTEAFADDPLRVLRGVQFSARFGFTMDPGTAALCRSLADSYAELSTERVWTEWHKIAAKGAHLSTALATLDQTGWEQHFPQIAALHDVEQDPTWHPEGTVHAHTGLAGDKAAELADAAGLAGDDRAVVVFAALAHDFGKVTHTQHVIRPGEPDRITSRAHAEAGVEPAREFLRSIGAPPHLQDRVLPLVREHMAATGAEAVSKPGVRRLARRLAPATMTEWALVTAADKGGRGAGSVEPGTQRWMRLADELVVTATPAQGILRGEHLIAAGMRPGPAFAPILRDSVAAQDDGTFTDEVGAVRWLRARLGLQ